MCVYFLSPTGNQVNCFVWLKYSLEQIPEIPILQSLWVIKNPNNSSDGERRRQSRACVKARPSFSLALKELRTSAPAERGERGRRMRENYCCQRVKEEEEEEKGESCLCVCVQSVHVYWHLPLALPRRSYCGELPARLGRSFSLYLFPFHPPSPSLAPFSPLFLPALFLFSPSLLPPTMVQDFYRQGGRAALLTEVSCMVGLMDERMNGCTVHQSSAANYS